MAVKVIGRDLITIRQAAEQLQTSERTIRRYLSAGLITGVRLGPRLIRIHADSVGKLTQPVGAR
ncbi:helix-turn-helix domain-containing protein [Mycolicibacterium fluoranthenivorans]|uniref:Excisionase family DNA binding protein n=1 Tax=Mycolicibacterium fluoranthenivorans TaxID=258505 RepID=A0A7X5TZP9_9MYCO|nr:helix-turn-helix domain-containing protein [Mycolicibacterium fluoranthenivorans]MCV7358172.1 helix-turn-helix domain-containing protein [Mycolicibacterium fluoranthenivorans]NIH95704.1 excisionase family DNA binding protein [Mycolicibacterium fluoranthenivorans]